MGNFIFTISWLDLNLHLHQQSIDHLPSLFKNCFIQIRRPQNPGDLLIFHRELLAVGIAAFRLISLFAISIFF